LEALQRMRGDPREDVMILLDLAAQRAKKLFFGAHSLDVDADAEPTFGFEVVGHLAHQPSLADAARGEHLHAGPSFEETRQFRSLLASVVCGQLAHDGLSNLTGQS
jgi:hypothetical protein